MCWQRCEETGTLMPCWWECKRCSCCGKQLEVPQKVKHRIIIGPSNSTPKYILESIENRYANKYLYRNIHSSPIPITKKVESTLMFINK